MPVVARDGFRFVQLFEALVDSGNNLPGKFLIETIKFVSDSC